MRYPILIRAALLALCFIQSARAEDSPSPAPVSAPNLVSPLPARVSPLGLAPTPFMGYTTFIDPTEHGFSVEVPAGWKVEGGMARASAIDVRPWVRVVSPDNLMVAFIGDGQICPGTVPTPLMSSLGYGIGRRYGTAIVLPYIPARKFAEKYAKLKLKNQVENLEVVGDCAHPDFAQAANGPCTRSEAASIKIKCNVRNIPAVGYYLASTKLNAVSGSAMWWVTYLAGELCPADREAAGLSVLLHMIQTFQLDPNWQRQSLQATAAVSEHYRQVSQQVSKSIVDRYWSQQSFNDSLNQAYWNRQAVQDRAAEKFSDTILGQQTVQDPTTGTQYKVQSGTTYHWIDPGGNIAGTNYSAPGPDWRQLHDVP